MEYQFKIQIKYITKPPVWRQVIIPADYTFLEFHEVIQTVFGWGNYHLFMFADKEHQGSFRIAIPSDDDLDYRVETLNAANIKLSDIFTGAISKLVYVYDFGDKWVHEITLEAVHEDTRKDAICLSGKGSCPPEDCGGPFGYENMKNVLRSKPDSEDADRYRDWLGFEHDETLDTDYFNVDETNAKLKHV